MLFTGMRISPYQIFFAASTRAFTAKLEFQRQPSSGRGLSRSISRSTHSPWGDISNSLYLLMCAKSVPTKTSATSQSQSWLVSLVWRGFGWRCSASYGQTNRK